ncbi:MAG: sigma 54-interacting transcriptional regulator [Melioribacteraceae bacterium]|nr:sigma 54-interacting transcriptional regulator [Melioribacteraceae bacterium]
MLESELFGHVKGAFTGAINNKAGLFQSAHKGSLFLDEVGEMSPSMQAKLLRVLQDYEVKPLGSNSVFKVDVRIIGANNMHLEELVKRKLFREDLYYRINVAEINVPALIERLEDIPLLIDHFIKNSESEKTIYFTDDAMKTLMNYSWSGNIRELENFIKTMLVLSDSKFIDKNMLPGKVSTLRKYKARRMEIDSFR